MMDKEKSWTEHWDKQSKIDNEMIVSGWGARQIREYLSDIDDICKKLNLKNNDGLLNIGCGNGLFEIVVNYWVKEIDSIDFSPGMVERAKLNNLRNKNINFHVGNILDMGFLKKRYDKVLCNSVIQYLNDLDEVEKALEEISNLCRENSRVLISANPHKDKLDEYLSGYDKLDISEEEKARKKEMNKLSLWTEPKEIAGIAKQKGFCSKVLKMNPNIWQSWYMYDLLLWKGNL